MILHYQMILVKIVGAINYNVMYSVIQNNPPVVGHSIYEEVYKHVCDCNIVIFADPIKLEKLPYKVFIEVSKQQK